MRRRNFIILILALLVMSGCNFGRKARDSALLPALDAAALGVEDGARYGAALLDDSMAAQGECDAFFDAFRTRPMPDGLMLLWVPIPDHCKRGFKHKVDHGAWGENVKKSHAERLRLFGDGLRLYLGVRDL